MAPIATPINLNSLSEGDRVQHELRVVSRETRNTRDGKPFVVLTLGNARGEMKTAPVWSESLSWVDGAERGRIVQVIGDITRYKGSVTQITLTAPVRVINMSLVKLDDFLPSIDERTEVIWGRLDRLRDEISSRCIRGAVGLFFDDDSFREQFERAPGSTRGHHAKVGGLLQHVAEVTRIACGIAKVMAPSGGQPPNPDLVIAGAMLHDIGKVEAYSVSATGFDTTTAGHLIGHIVLGMQMLERRHSALAEPLCSAEQLMELQHLILSHHGSLEFGSPVRPMTIEAEIVHWADESSAKASAFMDSMTDESLFTDGSGISDRIWMLDNRRIWQKSHDWD
ncbi:MAG TPA: HD domain-containing protein [Gemmatimonadales bacterium]|nr:HD domain-containing protein [Gemmatimonadales bacterium]